MHISRVRHPPSPNSIKGRAGVIQGWCFCHLLWTIDRPPRSEGFLFEGVGNFLTKGGEKTPLVGFVRVGETLFGGVRKRDVGGLKRGVLGVSGALQKHHPGSYDHPPPKSPPKSPLLAAAPPAAPAAAPPA